VFDSIYRSTFRACALAVALVAAGQTAFAQPPSITFLSPAGGQRGSTVDVTINGGNLVGTSAVWSDLPMTTSIPK
jgi:hypothetical protein